MPSIFIHVAIDALRLLVWLVLLAAIFVPLEHFFSTTERDRPIKPSPLIAEIGYYFLNSLMPALLLAVPLALTAALARSLLPFSYLSLAAGIPWIARLAVSLLVSELCSYWGHRLSHEWPYLWQFHGRHHEPGHINWLTNTHAHPIDIIWSRLTALFPIYALGLANPVSGQPGMIPVVMTVFAGAWAFFIHANIRWRFGLLEHLVVTPAFHHWHHSNDEWRDHNYATLLPVMDWVFGTYRLPDHFPPSYGIDRPDELAPLFPLAVRAPVKARPGSVNDGRLRSVGQVTD